MCVDEGEAGAGSPMTEKTVLNVVGGDVTLDSSVVLEENHRYENVSTVRTTHEQGLNVPAAM